MYTRRCQNLRGTARESVRKKSQNGDPVYSESLQLSTDLLHRHMYRAKVYHANWRQARLLFVLFTQRVDITGKQEAVTLALKKPCP
jgi:hypothetical protein